jgi:hypothetical protein
VCVHTDSFDRLLNYNLSKFTLHLLHLFLETTPMYRSAHHLTAPVPDRWGVHTVKMESPETPTRKSVWVRATYKLIAPGPSPIISRPALGALMESVPRKPPLVDTQLVLILQTCELGPIRMLVKWIDCHSNPSDFRAQPLVDQCRPFKRSCTIPTTSCRSSTSPP